MRPDLTKMTNEEIAESCEDAADLLEGHWNQGCWSVVDQNAPDENYTYCLEGALAAALGLDEITELEDFARDTLIRCPVYDAVLKTINKKSFQQLQDAGFSGEYRPSYGEGDLPNWNDSDGRTEQEVVDVLRATAKRVLTADV